VAINVPELAPIIATVDRPRRSRAWNDKKVVAALRDLASELAPPGARASRPTARSLAWAPERLAAAR